MSVRRYLTTAFAAVAALTVANSAYLAAAPSPTIAFYANVALHVVLGVTALVLAAAFYVARRHRLTTSARAAWWALVGCGGAGLWLAAVGATRAHASALGVHAALGAGAVLLVAASLDAAARTFSPPWRQLAAAGVVLGCLAVALPPVVRSASANSWARDHRIANPLEPPADMAAEAGGAATPFFPSSARTNVGGTIPSNFFMTSAACGRCHSEIYEQWRSSMHHMSSFNNQWYRKSIEYMQDVTGTQPSKWCAGCHDHAVFFNGRFDRPIKEQIDTPEAQAGLACTSCHSIVHVGSSMGQGDFTIEYPPLHDVANSDNPFLRRAHDALLYLAPEPHRQTFMKPFHREQTAEFCSACHKVHLDVPVNGYRWFRGFNDYDNWQASGVSGQGARSFYYPAQSQTCADCHMPLVAASDPAAKDGMVRSHRFAAANTAVPFVNHDTTQLKAVQDFLRSGAVTIDVFGIVRSPEPARSDTRLRPTEPRLSSTFAVGEESASPGPIDVSMAPPSDVVGPLDKTTVTVRRAETVRVEVVVRTRKIGHFFPAGTVDAFDVWVELEAVDENGRVLLHSGEVADEGRGPVDPGAHFYRSLQLDAHGNPINKRNAWMTRSVAYVRLVPPGAADTIHYRLRVPDDAGSRIQLRAKLNYRKFSWWNTQWAYGGVRDPQQPHPAVDRAYDDSRWLFTGDTARVSGDTKAIPNIPITAISEAQATIAVAPKGAAAPLDRPVMDRSVRERWNDYGIGLLLQGDLKNAEAVFRHVSEMDPAYADGPLNVARAEIQEGDTTAALEWLRRSLGIDPRLARTHFFLGSALKTLGRYEEALAHLQTASAAYPRDRVVLDQIGRIQFLERRYADAVTTFERVLRVDPEDLQAHYNLMLCYQALGDGGRAERERTLYERFKADEASQAITGPYRQSAPEDNNERQSIHEHGDKSAPAAGTR